MDIIKVKDVVKIYRNDSDRSHTLKERLLFLGRNKRQDRPILNGISLVVRKGETVGLIGENGCGKSTLLKLLTRIIYPNKGSIEINGRVSSLLELGAGFHPDMTGRENIYTNASIFGLTKEQINQRMDTIIEFSELGEFIESPVRTYSSGMYMRLAFSVAINVEADILLIDEILAVGDVNFQKKCFNKLKELKNSGITIIIVSHDLGSIERICDTVVWINNGRTKEIGEAKQVIDNYLQYMNIRQENLIERSYGTEEEREVSVSGGESRKTAGNSGNLPAYEKRWGGMEVEVTGISVSGPDKTSKHCFDTGESVRIRVDYKKNKKIEDIVFGIGISNSDGITCYGTNTVIDRINTSGIKDSGYIEFVIEELLLLEGRYSLDVAIHAEDGRAYDYIKRIYEFNIISNTKDAGICRLKHQWLIN